MTLEQKATYRKLQRQIGQSQRKAEIKGEMKYINQFNNRLKRMQNFLETLPEDYGNNRFMKMTKMF